MTKAAPSGNTLSSHDAAIVKGMLARGDRQHDIAAWFGVNGGRIADISTGKTFAHVAPQHDSLPPRGPYENGRDSARRKQAIDDTIGMIGELTGIVQGLEERLAEFK